MLPVKLYHQDRTQVVRILSYEDCGDCVTGILETEDAYVAFSVGPDDRLDLEQSYPKERYRDLAHFQGVMGKFEPCAFFLREPVEVEAVTFKALKELAQGATGKPLS